MAMTLKSLLLCSLGIALAAPNTRAEMSRVSVQSNRFVDAQGRPLVFRGLAMSDPDKLQRNGQWNAAYFDAAKSWGANIVRFPVHPAAWRLHGRNDYLKLLDQGIALAKERKLYVIIDWHSIGNLPGEKFFALNSELYPPDGYRTTKAETFEFWRTMARRYGRDPTVALFELFNEPALGGPMGTCTWAEWKALLEELIAHIRANGGKAVPLVAGFNFGYDLTPVAKEPLRAEGIGYVAHPYPMKAKSPWAENWTRDWGFVAEKYPLILTEIGFLPAEEPGGYVPITGDEAYGDALTAYCAARGISYTVWCFDPHWTPTIIRDWNFTPTRQGAYFKKAMQTPKGQ
jgi:hypothetical protein